MRKLMAQNLRPARGRKGQRSEHISSSEMYPDRSKKAKTLSTGTNIRETGRVVEVAHKGRRWQAKVAIQERAERLGLSTAPSKLVQERPAIPDFRLPTPTEPQPDIPAQQARQPQRLRDLRTDAPAVPLLASDRARRGQSANSIGARIRAEVRERVEAMTAKRSITAGARKVLPPRGRGRPSRERLALEERARAEGWAISPERQKQMQNREYAKRWLARRAELGATKVEVETVALPAVPALPVPALPAPAPAPAPTITKPEFHAVPAKASAPVSAPVPTLADAIVEGLAEAVAPRAPSLPPPARHELVRLGLTLDQLADMLSMPNEHIAALARLESALGKAVLRVLQQTTIREASRYRLAQLYAEQGDKEP